MKQRVIRASLGLLMITLALAALFTASSLASQQTSARVLGGAGTVSDPLRIEVSGQVGLIGLIDSLLPFRALPGVEVLYRDLSFSVPGLNPLLAGRPWLAFACLAASVLVLFMALAWTALALCGKRLSLVDSKT